MRYRPLRFFTVCAFTALFILWLTLCWVAFSSRSTFSFKALNTDKLKRTFPSGHYQHNRQHQQPWVGPDALVPPLVRNSTTARYHVRIIIRVHHKHKYLVHGLIHNLRHQQQLFASPDFPTLSMDFALVPTELAGVPVAQAIAGEYWLDAFDPFPHVYALNMNASFFATAFDRAASTKCTLTEAKEIAHMHNKAIMHKICDYDNHVYYQATDVAVQELLVGCDWCTHMLVTNDDNCYHPDYFKKTLLELDPPLQKGETPRPKKKKRRKRENTNSKKASMKSLDEMSLINREKGVVAELNDRGWDLVTTDFTTSGFYNPAEWSLSRVDLGGVLFSKEIAGKVGGFIAALPPHAKAMDAHNADWFFTEKALKMGGMAAVVNKLLFFHN